MEFYGKKAKSLLCGLLAIVLVLGSVLIAPPAEVEAATKQPAVAFQKNVRVGVGMRYSAYTSIVLTKKGQTVNKVKSNSKNLVIKKTSQYVTSGNPYRYTADYSIYAKKAGKYKISFNVVDAKGKKVGKTRTITVHAAGSDSVITDAKFGKTNMLSEASYSTYYTSKASGKVKFTLAKGCKIKRITVSKADKNGKWVSKKFKNGKNVELGTYAHSEGYSSASWYRELNASTEFKIVYTDSWSLTPKEEHQVDFTVYRRANKWYKR